MIYKVARMVQKKKKSKVVNKISYTRFNLNNKLFCYTKYVVLLHIVSDKKERRRYDYAQFRHRETKVQNGWWPAPTCQGCK